MHTLHAINKTLLQMRLSLLCLVLLSFLTSCLFSEPTEKQKSEIFQATQFEANVLNNQSKYNVLLNTVLENLDSIIKYNRSIHYSKKIDSIFYLIQTEKLAISKEKGNTLIRFDINRYQRQNKIIECHFLYWSSDSNFKYLDNFDFVKDTALGNNYVYRIGIATDNSTSFPSTSSN